MFTNEQIRTAMEGLVKKKGENHTSFARYADVLTGKGECFLGALCEHMGFAVPKEGLAAADVLGTGNISAEMGSAFQVAQTLNDSHFEWKYVLLGVDLSLSKFKMTHASKCPCGCGLSRDIRPIIDEVTRIRALDRNNAPAFSSIQGSFATGGYITGAGQKVTIDLSGITSTMNSLTYSLESLSASFGAFTGSFAEASLTKKDHTLVA
jgi:hypothetical protein